MMHGERMLFVDRIGNMFYASTVKELRSQIGGRVSKMYATSNTGEAIHIGYVVGKHWLTAYTWLSQH